MCTSLNSQSPRKMSNMFPYYKYRYWATERSMEINQGCLASKGQDRCDIADSRTFSLITILSCWIPPCDTVLELLDRWNPAEQLLQGFSLKQKLQSHCTRDKKEKHTEGRHLPMISSYFQAWLWVIPPPSREYCLREITGYFYCPLCCSQDIPKPYCLCLYSHWCLTSSWLSLQLCTYSSSSCPI